MYCVEKAAKRADSDSEEEIIIGAPIQGTFKHDIHVDFSSDTGFRVRLQSFCTVAVIVLIFVRQGLPKEWEALLKSNGITKADVVSHAQEVLDVLEFQDKGFPQAAASEGL